MAMIKEICKYCLGHSLDCQKCNGLGYILTLDKPPYQMGNNKPHGTGANDKSFT
jgi:hypothetical protein